MRPTMKRRRLRPTKKRRRFKQDTSLEERIAREAQRWREQANSLPPGQERETLLKKARLADTAVSDLVSFPGL